MNIFWTFMIVTSIFYQLFTGGIEKVSKILFEAPQKAFEVFFTIFLSIILWSGFLRVIQDSNLVEVFKKVFRPVLAALFETKNEKALNFIVLNVIANMLGLGNAATPAGVLAMQELSKEACRSEASDDMILFVLLNTCSVQLIPTTVIFLRTKFYSSAPTVIIFPTLFISMTGLFVGIILCKILSKVRAK